MVLPKLWNIFREHDGFGSDKWTSYFETYDNHFGKYRQQAINLLEIGVQNGGSLEIWAKYFPKAKKIIGCDIDEKCRSLSFEDTRIKLVVGDANLPDVHDLIANEAQEFDIVIDDGSHVVSDVIKSFSLYFPMLRVGGSFVVEDLHTSYWDWYGGGSDLTLSSMGFLKLLTDIVNKEFWRDDRTTFNLLVSYAERYNVDLMDLELDIEEVSFRNSVCVIKKGSPNARNRRHISGNTFFVTDHKSEKEMSGTDRLVEKLNISQRLSGATDEQAKYITALGTAVPNQLEIDRLKCANGELLSSLSDKLQEAEVLRSEIQALRSSTSWRITAPLRRLFQWLR